MEEDDVIISGTHMTIEKDKLEKMNENNFEKIYDNEYENIYRSKCSGILLKTPYYPYKYDIMNTSYKYIPKVGDLVIGIVKSKKLDYYQMDINCNCECIIHKIDSFKYATKSSFPNLLNGTLLYMVVEKMNLENNSVVTSCINSSDVKSWINYENYLGELVDGFVFSVNIASAKSLIGDRCYILDLIGQDIKYEIAVGHNGRFELYKIKNILIYIYIYVKNIINIFVYVQYIYICIYLLFCIFFSFLYFFLFL